MDFAIKFDMLLDWLNFGVSFALILNYHNYMDFQPFKPYLGKVGWIKG